MLKRMLEDLWLNFILKTGVDCCLKSQTYSILSPATKIHKICIGRIRGVCSCESKLFSAKMLKWMLIADLQLNFMGEIVLFAFLKNKSYFVSSNENS